MFFAFAFKSAVLPVLTAGILGIILGLLAPATRDAEAYNECYPGDSDCHLIWDDAFDSQVAWTDLTGWGGSYATAVANSGLTWHYASSLDIVQVYGPYYEIDVTRYDFGSSGNPGRTILYLYDSSAPTKSDIFAADIQLNSHNSYI